MFLFRLLLYPLSVVYGLVTAVRNRLYDIGIKPSARFDMPLISIGNITVGGTGKTPMVEYLVRLLKDEYALATLSRGYGRKTRGFRIANAHDSAETLGDEPYQLYTKFTKQAIVSVGEDRAMAIPTLMDTHPQLQVVLLDDAFQHRRITPSLNILLTDFHRLIYKDHLLPAGRLRESVEGARRADVMVVTKCPKSVSEEERMMIQKSLTHIASRPVFFATIRYGNPIGFGKQVEIGETVLLLTGIANSRVFKEHVAKSFTLSDHLEFKDHHAYTKKDIQKLKQKLTGNTMVLTTEKDMVKLIHPDFQADMATLPIFYLPIETVFVKDGEDFDAIVLNHVHERISKNVYKEA